MHDLPWISRISWRTSWPCFQPSCDLAEPSGPSGWQALWGRSHISDRETDEEGRSPAHLGGERELAAVPVHHDRPGKGETLPGAPAELLGREELVEDLVCRVAGDAASVVFHRDEGGAILAPGANADAARLAGIPIGDGMSGVDDEVEEHLAELALITRDRREVAEVRLHLGEMPVLAPGDGQRVGHQLVQVQRAALRIREPEPLHGADNGGHSLDAVECAP